VPEVEDATCAHAYILNGLKAIDMLLDTVNIVEFTEPFDFMWTEAMYKKNNKGFDSFAYLPNDIIVQNRSLAT
jgi:hypothetical protein